MNINHNISAVIIACNEEKYIKQCIESILPITKDIILIDSGSTDKTIEIASAAGAIVYNKPWQGYGANKNYGNSFAKHDWILSVDADEVIDTELQKYLKTLDKKLNTIYKIKSLVSYNGKWIYYCGWHPAWKLRLFHKATVKWDLTPVHESLIYPSTVKIDKLKGQFLHYSYDSIIDHREKSYRYGLLKAKTWVKKGKSVNSIKRILGPTFKFLRTYLFKLGFLDGKEGFIISKIDAHMIRTAITHYDQLKKKE